LSMKPLQSEPEVTAEQMAKMTREKEQELIGAVRGGNIDAFEELVLEYQTRVYNIALKMTGNADDAYDVSQEVFLKAFKALDGFRGEASFGSWLYRLAANLSVDFIRRQARRRPDRLVYLDDDSDEERPVEIPDFTYEPQAALERRELLGAVEEGIKKLPEEQRLVLVMRDVNGLSYAEISEALDMELGTVKSRIFRARARLANFLTEGPLSGKRLSDASPSGKYRPDEGNFSSKPSSKKRKGR